MTRRLPAPAMSGPLEIGIVMRTPPWKAVAMAALLCAGGCSPGTPESPAPASAPAPAISVSNVVEEHLTEPAAIVNGVTIYQATYEELVEDLRGRIPPNDPDSVEKYVRAKIEALDKLVDEELLFQEAIRRGHEPSPAEVARIYSERVAKAGGEAQLLSWGRARGYSKSELLNALRRKVSLDRFVEKEVEPSLSATDEEVRAYYDSRPERFTPEVWVKIAQIWMAAPFEWPASRRADALTRITRVQQLLTQGESFESLARAHSEDEAGQTGGLLGLFKKGNLDPAIERVAFRLKPGEVSEVVEGASGFHLLKVHERIGGTLEPFEKVREEARKELLMRKRGEFLNALLDGLHQKASISRLIE